MTADVSSLVRLLNGYNDDRPMVRESARAKSMAPAIMTRDLLGSGADGGGGGGGGGGNRSLELDLDLQVPTGWEKRLDLKSGKVYLQRCNSTSSSSITNADQSIQTVPTFQDLNFPPKPLLNLFDDATTERRLLSPSRSRALSISPNHNFQSVCTLDKVKSALERAKRDPAMLKKRQLPDDTVSDELRTKAIGSPVAAGCPGCLSYVLVMKNNPRCPRCDTTVHLPENVLKKPKIDLNISI